MTDNADLVIYRDGLKYLRGELLGAMKSLCDFAEKYKDMPTLGYTHYQPAQPVTVGKRASLWLQDLAADLEEGLKTNVVALARAQALKAQYETAVTNATEEAYQHIDATADDILAQLASGADWDALMAEKGQDPGMKSGSTAENGYAVCENFSDFDTNFTSAAMGLQNVGDVSDKTRGSYGYYIVKYISDVAEGAVDLDSVKDLISGDLLKTAQDNYFTEQVAQWVKDAAAKINKNALKD